MSSLNKVTLIGRLGKDPEIRSVTSGDKVANFSIACSESWTDKRSGERKEKTEWINVVVWGDGLVGVIEKYVSKGDQIYVEGAFKTRKYEKNGEDRYVSECVVQGIGGKVVLLGGKKSDDGGNRRERETESYGGFDSRGNAVDTGADLDDEIPF